MIFVCMNLIFREITKFQTSCRECFFLALTRYYKQYHQVHFLIILFGKMSSSESLSSSSIVSETERMTDFEKFGLQPYSLEPTKSKVPVGYGRNSMSVLPTTVMQPQMMQRMVEQVTKPGTNMNAVLQWKQAQKMSVAQKFLRFASQYFQVGCVCTFVDQIHILFHDVLCEKNPLTI